MAVRLYQLNRAGHAPRAPQVDITFMLSNAGNSPGFQGMRMGGYTEESKILYFEIAVPVEMAYSPFATDYVTAILFDALDNAADFFNEQRILFNKPEWQALLRSIVNEDKAPMTSH